MATNKVIYGNTTLIDTSEDTAEVGDVLAGETFHSKSGAQLTGTMTATSTPTANTIAKFDSSAHMNSADMTTQEIDDFVDSVPSAFDNLKNLNVLHDITAGGDITDGAGVSIAKLAEVNYVHASMSSNQTLSSSDNTTLNLDTVVRRKGWRLTLDAAKHGVVVGAGVNNVEVFAEAYFFTQTTQAGKNIYVINTGANGSRATMARGLLNITTNYNTVCTFEIFSVSEGDVITIEAVANSGTVIAAEYYTTKLIVRALG